MPNLGVLRYRVLHDEGVVHEEAEVPTSTAFSRLMAAVHSASQQHPTSRVVGLMSDPDGDIWPEGDWHRVITLEPWQ